MIKLSKIEKIYNKGKSNEYRALNEVSLVVNDGEMIAITGKSGAGKSTLLHILACVDTFESGEYMIDDLIIKNLSEKELASIRNERIGIVMQDFALVDDYTCVENVILPLDFSNRKCKKKVKIAINALKVVGMNQLAEKKINNLSGGQKQRVAIARAIVNEPSILLADEPTGALDSKTSAEIMGLFKTLNKQGRTIVIVTHDPNIASQCNRTIEISDGKIVS